MLGSHLVSWRQKRRLSQQSVADKAGLLRPYLSKLERNQADPSLSTMRRLASALEITVGQLVDTKPMVPALDRFALEELAKSLHVRDRRSKLGERALRHLRIQLGEKQWQAVMGRLQKLQWAQPGPKK